MDNELRFTPIYKGIYGAVPVTVYVEEQKTNHKLRGQDVVCWLLTLISAGYLVLACLR